MCDGNPATRLFTPFGQYRWLRMGMGILPVPEIFQGKLTKAFGEVTFRDNSERSSNWVHKKKRRMLSLQRHDLDLEEVPSLTLPDQFTNVVFIGTSRFQGGIINRPMPLDTIGWPSLIGLWGRVRLNICCTLSYQCPQVKPAISTQSERSPVCHWRAIAMFIPTKCTINQIWYQNITTLRSGFWRSLIETTQVEGGRHLGGV